MPITPTNQAKNSITPTTISKTFNSVYSLARYGISKFGTGIIGAGFFSNKSKDQTEFMATEALDYLITEGGDYVVSGGVYFTNLTKN